MSDKPKKTLWHGELRDMGQVEVLVKAEARKSSYSGKPDYVELMIGGHLRQYQVENPSCGDFFRGKAGQSILIEARDSRETASIHLMAPARGQQAPPPQQQQQPPQQPAQPTNVRPQNSPTTNQPPASTAPPKETAKKKTAEELAAEQLHQKKEAVLNAMKAANRRANGFEIAMKAVDFLAERRQKSGRAMTPEQFQGTATSIFISMERAGLVDALPVGELDKYLPEEKPKQ